MSFFDGFDKIEQYVRKGMRINHRSIEKEETTAELSSIFSFGKKSVESVEKVDSKIEKMDADQYADLHGEGAKKPKGKVSSSSSWQKASHDVKSGKNKSSSKKSPSKKSKKSSSKSGSKSKDFSQKPSKKQQKGSKGSAKPKSSAAKKSSSGKGTGQAGRTGPRKRRSVGDVWMGPSGFHHSGAKSTALWTKRKDGTIERLSPKERADFRSSMKKRGRSWKDGWDAALQEEHWTEGYGSVPKDTHKKRTELVQRMENAKGLSDRYTKESRAEMLKKLKDAGFATDKELEMLNSLMGEMAYHKMSRGSWRGRNQAMLKRDFLDGMDPQNYESYEEFNEAKKRIESMTPDQIEQLIKIIQLDDEDEDIRDEFGIEQYSPEVHSKLKGNWGGDSMKNFDAGLAVLLKGYMNG